MNARKIGKRVAIGVSLVPLVAAVLVALAFALLRVRAFEHEVLSRTNVLLGDVFQGKIVLERVRDVTLGGARVDAHVLDPAGRKVVVLRDATARLFWPRLVWDAVRGANPLVIDIEEVAIHDAVIRYVEGNDGAPTLAAAFVPREAEPPEPPGPPSETRVLLHRARIDHAWVHGAVGTDIALDADLSDFGGSVNVDGQGWSVAVDRTRLVARNLLNGLDPSGTFSGKVGGSLSSTEPDAPLDATARFEGTVARTPFEAKASLEKGLLKARADAPGIAPEVVTRFVPGLSPVDESHLTATAEGRLPDVTINAEASSGPARAHLEGTYDAADAPGARVKAKITAARVDVSRLSKGAARTDLGGTVNVDATLAGDGRVSARYTASFHGATVDGQRVPDLDLEGKATLDVPRWEVRGEADVAEPGAPTHLVYELSGNQGSTEVLVIADARLDRPQRLLKLAGVTTSGSLHAMARVSPESGRFTAKVEGKLGPTAASGVSAGELAVNAEATGPFEDPILDVKVTLRALQLPARRFDRASVRARGKLSRARVEAELAGKAAEIRLYATVAATPALAVENPAITLVDDEGVVRVATRRLAVRGERIEVEGLTIDGAGHAGASLVYDGDLRRLQLESTDLDVARLLRIAEVDAPGFRGKVSLVASYDQAGGKTTALLRGRARGIEYQKVHGGSATVDLTFSERTLSGKASFGLGTHAEAELSLEDVTFDGKPTRPRLETLRGVATLNLDADLESLQSLLTLREVPFDHAEGHVKGRIVISREATGQLPKATLHLKTQGFELVGKRPELEKVETAQEALDATVWALRGVDFEIDGEGGGETRSLQLRLRAVDEGELATLEADVSLPSGDSLAELQAGLESMTGKAVLRMPERRLRRLPEIARPRAVTGALAFELRAEGSVRAPHVELEGKLTRFGSAGQRMVDEESTRVDVDFGADYRASGGDVRVAAGQKGRSVARLAARWRGDLAKLPAAASQTGPSPVEGDVELMVDAFPIDAIAQAKNRQIGGTVSGKISLVGLGKDARAEGRLEAAPLELGQTALDRLGVSLATAGDQVRVQAWASGQGGSLKASAESKLTWKDALVPVMDPNLHGHVSARRFRLGAVSPFLVGAVSELDGRLDAELDARLVEGVPTLNGHAEFDSGSLSVPTIGQQMTDIRGKVVLNPRQARLTDFHAKGETGSLSATATVDFAERFQVTAARAQVKIAEDEKLPITLEGVTLGEAWGNVEATLAKDPLTRESRIAISVPDLHVEIPETGQADVQALDADPHVRIGAVRKDGVFVLVPTQPLESAPVPTEGEPEVTVIDVKLGKITVERGQEVRIGLTGNLKVRLAREMVLTGQIRTTGGRLDVTGKLFEVERGTITFDGETPPNPTIVATARWDSPVGYRVYADYSGTATKARLKLRSEPSLSSDQILSLLMFGSPDGAIGGSQGGGARQSGQNRAAGAVGVAGGTAAKGINRALSDLTDLDIQARVDTSGGRSSGPYADTRVRPEIVFQISQRVAARVTRAVGAPVPGTSPDRTFLTFEFRLSARWLVSSLVGDRGATALDLLWRYRY